MKFPLTSIVVLNWNGKDVLRDSLGSLLKQNYPTLEVIMVDNGSTDGSVNFVKENFPKIKIIENGENLGYDEGLNVGYRHSKGKYVIMLNNDTWFPKDFVSSLVKTAEEDEKIAIVSPGQFEFNADINDLNQVGSTGNVASLLGLYVRSQKKIKEKIVTSDGCCLVRKSAFDVPYDKDYFIFGDEDYIGYRCLLKGFKIIYEPKAKYKHLGSHATKHFKKGVVFKTERNNLLNFFRFFSRRTLLLLTPILLFSILTKLIYLVLTLKFRILYERIGAWFWLMRNFKIVLEKRRYSQKERKVSDKAILNFIVECKYLPEKMFDRFLFRIYKIYVKLIYPFLE